MSDSDHASGATDGGSEDRADATHPTGLGLEPDDLIVPPLPGTKAPGTTVDKYIVLHQRGAGGMGVVYAAYDPKLDRKIALKVLHDGFGHEQDPVARVRLLAEGRALARVNHRNVVTVFDVGSIEDEVYVAMELIEGQTLREWRKRGPHPWPRIVEMFIGIAEGLQAVHAAGLVHRDVKPDNILIDDRDGQPRVTDFGLARSHGDAPESLEATERELVSSSAISSVELTRAGARLGTPAYMSSEQLQGRAATAKGDQFSLCVALWECLYGVRPYAGNSWASLLLAMRSGDLQEPSETPSGRPVPGWLRRIILRGLSLEPSDRWPTIAALARALQAGDPDRGKRRLLAGLGVGVLALGIAGAAYAQRHASRAQAVAECQDLGAAIDTEWTPQTHEDLHAAFVATGVGNADAIADGIVETFDGFTGTWAEQRSDACIAGLPDSPAPPPLLAQRIQCLETHRAMFETLVDAFTDADDIVVKRAQRSVESLADLESCLDDQRLKNTPAPPEDPAIRQEVRDLLAMLGRTQVHEHIGHFDQGQAMADEALERALQTGHRPLIAQAHYRVAVFLEKRGKYDKAVTAWVAAFREARLGGHPQLAAEAASALAFTEGYQLERYDTGIRWAQLAGIELEQLGMTQTLTEATRLDVLAVLREMKGDYERSIATHHDALALRRELVPPDHHSIGYGLVNLAGVLKSAGQVETAQARLLEALPIIEAAFGPTNPTTGHVLENLASVHVELGHYAEAEALLTRDEAIWSENLSPDHPDVGDVKNSLADIRREQGRFDEAAGLHRDALAIHRQGLDPGHPDIAASANRLGQVEWLRGQTDAAEASFRLALATLRNADDGQRDGLGRARHGLGLIELERGRPAPADELFSRARLDFEAHGDGHPRWVARTTIGAAAARLIAGDASDAERLLQPLMDDDSLAPSARAEAHAWYARVMDASGDPTAAAAGRRRATELVADSTADVRARIERVLGEPAAPETAATVEPGAMTDDERATLSN